ncbi:MAG: TrkH family potassium uptake protein [Oscillospiraceae bacterium]|nr:TrkH family potassium uptake protein [Oscillospiraceae bacterium]
MNLSMIAYIVGCVLEIEAALLLLPAGIGLLHGEQTGWAFLAVAAGAALIGLIVVLRRPKNTSFFAREGLVATALSWLVMSAVGAIPFRITGQIPHYLDALFEMVSGFTTTGASILLELERLDKCMLFWRSFSHWIGGMGVLVFMLAILPLAGSSGQNLYLMRAESPGPTVDKLSPKMRSSAAWLYGIYLGLSLLDFTLLMIGGMTAFDAACLTFGTAGTGGFGVVGSSFAGYSMMCKVVTTIFMLLFGMNFNLYYLLILRRFRDALKMSEIRWYLLVFLFASGTILLNLRGAGILGRDAQPIDAFFSVSSIMTTTGYATVDFDRWPTYSRMILVAIMFSGACAGSTGGGIKISRFMIYFKAVSKELRRMAHPRSVRHLRIDGKRVEDGTMQNTFVYLVVFVAIYAASVLILALDDFDPTTTFTAVAATINNIGPGLGRVGPAGNFSGFSYLSKCVLIFDMLAGRLEIYPLVIFFLPSTWRKQA